MLHTVIFGSLVGLTGKAERNSRTLVLVATAQHAVKMALVLGGAKIVLKFPRFAPQCYQGLVIISAGLLLQLCFDRHPFNHGFFSIHDSLKYVSPLYVTRWKTLCTAQL